MVKINTNYKVPADAREYKHLNGKPKIKTAADENILHFVENDKNNRRWNAWEMDRKEQD